MATGHSDAVPTPQGPGDNCPFLREESSLLGSRRELAQPGRAEGTLGGRGCQAVWLKAKYD